MSRLNDLTKGVARGVSELSDGSGVDSDPRSYDSVGDRPYIIQRQDYDRESAPRDDMSTYWRQYETTPFVRKPINDFSNRIIEPGYYFEYPEEIDREIIEDLYQWAETCAIISGEQNINFRDLAQQSLIQREVRGTSFTEKVYAKEDREHLTALKPLHPETIEVNTRPGQAILLEEDDHEEFDWEDVPKTPEGKAAAYLQDLSNTQVSWGRAHDIRRLSAGPEGDSRYPNKIGFTRNEIVKLERDNDVGEIFGTSRLESVSDRIEGLKQKLSDNDRAIESKAYPMWLFKFGVGEDTSPWPRDQIDDFMSHHDMENFDAGMKQGVRGDVEVETISGEVADIAYALQFDLNYILSAMPMASQALGGLTEGGTGSAAEVAGMGQEIHIDRQIRNARRQIETRFTPVFQEKAEQLGASEDLAEKVKLKLGDPRDERGMDDPSTSTSRIEYHGVGNDEDRDPSGEQPDVPPEQVPESDGSGDGGNGQQDAVDTPSAADVSPFGDMRGVVRPDIREHAAELAEDSETFIDDLQEQLDDMFVTIRDNVLADIASQYRDSPTTAAYNFPHQKDKYVDRHTGRQFKKDIQSIVEAALGDLEHTREYSMQHRERVKLFTEDVREAVRDALHELLGDMRVQLTRAAQSNESFEQAKQRIMEYMDDDALTQRAYIIAHMEIQNAREKTKLQVFEQDDNIVGVRVHNPDASTPVSEAAHGVEAYFADGSIGKQIRDEVPERYYHEEFDPLPPAPPYHFGDTTVLEPIYEDEGDNE